MNKKIIGWFILGWIYCSILVIVLIDLWNLGISGSLGAIYTIIGYNLLIITLIIIFIIHNILKLLKIK